MDGVEVGVGLEVDTRWDILTIGTEIIDHFGQNLARTNPIFNHPYNFSQVFNVICGEWFETKIDGGRGSEAGWLDFKNSFILFLGGVNILAMNLGKATSPSGVGLVE